MKQVLKKIMDFIYVSPLRLQQFKKLYPGEQVIAYGACKGITKIETSSVKHEKDWITASRGMFILSDKRVYMNKWMVPLDLVEDCKLQMYASGMVLTFAEKQGAHYQFGLQYDKNLLNQRVLDMTMSEEKMKYSFFSIALRVFVITMIIVELGRFIIK